MDKISINLLPKDLLEKRKSERRLTFMIFGTLMVAILLASGYGFNYLRIMQEEAKLDMIKAENGNVVAQIAKVADYEKNKIVVEEREKLVNSAIAGKYSWSRFLNNVSLIVPNEVWLTQLSVGADGEVKFSGQALGGTISSDIGHKPVAKWLVRLAELKDVEDVWLSLSVRSASNNSAAAAGPTLVDDSNVGTQTVDPTATLGFSTSAKIKKLSNDGN